MKSIERLEETLDQETAALMAQDVKRLDDFTRRKSQSLLELTRLARSFDGKPLDPDTAERIERLKVKLEHNRKILEMNLRAVQEVSDIISGAIQRADSDGTYSARLGVLG